MSRKEVSDVKDAKFIVFEGIDGCGKSTQLDRFVKALQARGRAVTVTKEPTDNEIGKYLRSLLQGKVSHTPTEQAALFVLDRIRHNREKGGIEQTLASGSDVVCDRYYYSSLSYQGYVCDYEWIKAMNCQCPDIRRPDLCIFLDLPPAVSLERITARGGEKEIFETEETLTRVREAFLRTFRDLPDRVAIVDATGTPDEVAERVWAAAKDLF